MGERRRSPPLPNPLETRRDLRRLFPRAQVFVSVSVVMNNVVSADRRGELNGLGMMAGSLAKAVGPFFFAVVFAWSIERPRPFPYGSHFAFILMGLGMMLVAAAGWSTIVRHEDSPAPGALRKGGAETELVASPAR